MSINFIILKQSITIKRIYQKASKADGYRVLIDRIWPRGISKEEAKLDEWDKDIAPSTALRKWFGHEADRFEAFEKQYRDELRQKEKELQRLRGIAAKQKVTLLYGAKSEKLNHAVVLQQVLTTSG